MPSFSLVIPTYNRVELLRITLDTVAALSVPEGWTGDVLVVDNNSTDGTGAVVEELRDFPLPLRRVIEIKQGLNHARNRGMEEASGEWLIYLDDDIKVAPGWLDAFAEAVEIFRPDAVVGPVFPWFETDAPSWCTGRVLDSVTSAYSRKGERALVLAAAQGHELPGCNFAVRRRVAQQVGGFHPALDRNGNGMLAGGDFEFGKRIVRRGAVVLYVPGCRVDHLISRRKMSKEGLRERWHGTGKTIKLVRKIHGDANSVHDWCRDVSRLLRFQLRALFLARRAPETAFRWELEALALRALLLGRPSVESGE